MIGWKVLGRADQTGLGWLRARMSESLWQWLRVWRWPAGLVAVLVLWVALVAVVGAAPPAGGRPASSSLLAEAGSGSIRGGCAPAEVSGYNSNVINLVYSSNMGAGPTAILSAPASDPDRIDCRPGLPPRP